MKRVILGIVIIVIFLLIFGFTPLHELGHIIVAKALGGEVIEIYWLSFSPIIGSQGVYCGGGVHIENISCVWKWVLIFLSGGLFQGLIYFAISFFCSFKKFLRSERRQAFRAIYLTGLVLGSLGFIASICEFWMANGGIYSL